MKWLWFLNDPSTSATSSTLPSEGPVSDGDASRVTDAGMETTGAMESLCRYIVAVTLEQSGSKSFKLCVYLWQFGAPFTGCRTGGTGATGSVGNKLSRIRPGCDTVAFGLVGSAIGVSAAVIPIPLPWSLLFWTVVVSTSSFCSIACVLTFALDTAGLPNEGADAP
jgi:hypothetical protein